MVKLSLVILLSLNIHKKIKKIILNFNPKEKLIDKLNQKTLLKFIISISGFKSFNNPKFTSCILQR